MERDASGAKNFNSLALMRESLLEKLVLHRQD